MQGVREALSSNRVVGATDMSWPSYQRNERMNERINARAQGEGRRPDVEEISWIAERFDENVIECKVMRDALIRCQEGNGVCMVSFRCVIRLREKLSRQESQARTLARHTAICLTRIDLSMST